MSKGGVSLSNSAGVGWITMAFILMSKQIGFGILSVPTAYRQLGYVGGTATILLLSATTTYTGHLITRMRKDNPTLSTYDQLFAHAFHSRTIGTYVSCCVHVFLFSVICRSVLIQADAWNRIFDSSCTTEWVAVTALVTLIVLQIRTIRNIGILSIINFCTIMLLNVFLMYSFSSYILSGSHKAGSKVLFPTDGGEASVSILDILFSFAGHCIYLELMQEMLNPDDFTKSLWLSQGVSTFFYLVNGLLVYSMVGDAIWMQYPATSSLKEGLPKKICHALVVTYFSSSMLVDGTCFVRKLDGLLRPKLASGAGKQKAIDDELSMYAPASDLEKGSTGNSGSVRFPGDPGKGSTGISGSVRFPGEASNRSSKQILEADDDLIKSKSGVSGVSPWVDSSWWLLWSALTMMAAFLIVKAGGSFEDLPGIVAALIACQTTISWPSVLFYQLYERAKRRSEDCYYHGSGTAPCHCAKKYRLLSPRVLLLVIGVVLGIVGVWGNSVELAAYWKHNKTHIEFFGCRKIRKQAWRKHAPLPLGHALIPEP